MWHREFRDYRIDQKMIKESIEPGKGIVGCEMHEINGWGNTLQHPQKKKRGFLGSLIAHLFHSSDKEELL